MTEDTLSLAADFPPTSYDDWLKAVEPVLKGAPFDKKLLHKTYEGLTLRPLYRAEDWPAEGDPSGFPGFAPFSRGGTAAGRPHGWDLRQEVADPDPEATNRLILADLQRGATSVLLRFDAAARAGCDADTAPADTAGRDGLLVYSADDLDRVLAGVDLAAITVALEAGAQAPAAAGLLAGVWQRRGLAPALARAAFNADPLGTWAATGTLPVPVETALADLADLACHTARTYPLSTAVGVATAPYHGAGADEAFDLACALATGVADLRAMTAAGLDIDTACRQILVSLPVGCDQFLGIAKLRAARKLWARVAEACGAGEPARALRLHAHSAAFMLTRRDPWVNLLRTTVAGFAAAAGGADSIALHAYDAALGLPGALGRRIARNTQIILDEESSLNRVIDPGGGSWFIESLTDDLARAAWSRFQAIEAAGGMVEALRSGLIHKTIDETYAARLKNVASRRQPITGVSEFPNIQEILPEPPAPDLAALRTAAAGRLAVTRSGAGEMARLDPGPSRTGWEPGTLAERIFEAAEAGATIGSLADALAGEPAELSPLPCRRLAEPFEALRDAADAWQAKTGRRPAIFLANLGPVAQHTGRATFAKNFFEAGGIEALGTDGFADAAACAEAYKASGTPLAILCSSDTVYDSLAAPTAQALKQAGCRVLFLAGSPGDKKAAYQDAGIDDFIFIGCNVLDVLKATLGRLGVTAS